MCAKLIIVLAYKILYFAAENLATILICVEKNNYKNTGTN